MPLASMQLQNKIVGIFNNKIEKNPLQKKINLPKRVETISFDFGKRTIDIINCLENIQNVGFTLNIKKENNCLGLILRSLLLSSLVGTSEISAQGYKNKLSIRNHNSVNPLEYDNKILDINNDNLMMSYIRNKRGSGNNCGEIELERKEINKQKKINKKNARENARKIRRNARKAVKDGIRNSAITATSNANIHGSSSIMTGTGIIAGTGIVAGTGTVAGASSISNGLAAVGTVGGLAVIGGIGILGSVGKSSNTANTNVNEVSIYENNVGDQENKSHNHKDKKIEKLTESKVTNINNNELTNDKLGNIKFTHVGNNKLNNNINNIKLMDVNQPPTNDIPAAHVDVSHIPILDRFMPPMKYFDFLYNGEKFNVINEIEDAIKLHYNSENIHLHYFNAKIDTIPEEYFFLRQIAPKLKIEVEAAKNYVRSALNRFQNAIKVIQDVADPYKIILQHKTNNGYVVNYFRNILNTQDPHIVDEALVRFYNALINMRNYFNEKIDKIIFATSMRNDIPHVHNENAPMGFVMTNDQQQRVIIMADQFAPQYLKSTKPQITLLHEVSHHAVATRDFVLSPTTRVVGDALDFVDAMEEALSDEIHLYGEKTIINFDLLFMQAYSNFIGDIPITVQEIKEMAKIDPILRANIIMDNADFLARFIFDIGQGISCDSGLSSRAKRNSHSEQENQKIILSKTLMFLSNRINGDYHAEDLE